MVVTQLLKRHWLLADQNSVTLSYRKEAFQRIKPKNGEKIKQAMSQGKVDVRFNTNVEIIDRDEVAISNGNGSKSIR